MRTASLRAALLLATVLAGCGSGTGSSTGGSGGTGASAGLFGDAGSSSGGTVQSNGGKGNDGSAGDDGGTEAGGPDLGAGGAEQASGGAGGSQGVARTCQSGVMNGAPAPASYDEVNTTSGDNGTFTDECDADGNLIEYICQYVPPTPQDPGRYTGQVIPTMVNCGGGCQAGACYVSKDCPMGNDEVTWVSASATTVVIDNPRAQVRYTCTTRTAPYDFDCNDPNLAGTKAKVNSVGPCSTITDLSVDTPANGTGTTDCVYECTESPI